MHTFITEHLHVPLPGAMQETVVARANILLSYWLSASYCRN